MPDKRFILRRPFPYTYRRYALLIIFINFLIYGIRFLYPNLAEYVHYYGAMNPVLVEQYHMYWQFLTYMFVHGNFQHIFFNMLALLIFGLLQRWLLVRFGLRGLIYQRRFSRAAAGW